MIRLATLTALAVSSTFVQPVLADDADAVFNYIDQRAEVSAATARQLWEWAELGYQEEKSSQLLQQHWPTRVFLSSPVWRACRRRSWLNLARPGR